MWENWDAEWKLGIQGEKIDMLQFADEIGILAEIVEKLKMLVKTSTK